MIHLDLTEEEAAAVREIVEWRLRDLPREISHTDHAPFRERLREQAKALERVLARIGSARAA